MSCDGFQRQQQQSEDNCHWFFSVRKESFVTTSIKAFRRQQRKLHEQHKSDND